MKKQTILAAILALILILSMFLGDSYAAKLTKVIVALDWYINPDQAPLLVAKQKGFFRQQGLRVIFVPQVEAGEPMTLVASGKADFAISNTLQLLLHQQRGMKLKWVATEVNQPLNCIAVLKSSGITSLSQLKGKSIGYSGGSMPPEMIDEMLKHNGINPNQVQLVNVKMGLLQALLSKNVSAVSGMMRPVEPVELAEIGHPTRLFLPESNGIPSYNELTLVVRDNVDPSLVKRFVKALTQGARYLRHYPQKSWKLMVEDYPNKFAPSSEMEKTNYAIWQAMVPYFTVDPGHPNRVQMLRFKQKMVELGLLK